MFILPQKDVRRLGGNPALDPIDAGTYFWLQMMVDDGTTSHLSEAERWGYGVEYKFREAALYAVQGALQWLSGLPFPEGETYHVNLKSHPLDHFAKDGSPEKRIQHRQGARLSTSLLMWPDELLELGIEAEPGYLYLRVPPLKDGRLSPSDSSRLEEERMPKLSLSWSGKKKALTVRLSHLPKGRIRDLEILLNAREVTPAENIPAPEMIFSVAGDRTETRAAAIQRAWASDWIDGVSSDESTYRPGRGFRLDHDLRVLKTPFEFPLGYVTDTANYLSSVPGFRRTKFAKSFYRFVYSPETLERALRSAPARIREDSEMFPRGEPNFSGADLAWRYSDNPWLVQLVLFARLIGGGYLSQTLGSLALNYGDGRSNWNSPLFVSEKHPRIAQSA